MDGWISITEAAARLAAAGDIVDRSTLSRYLKQHGEALPLREEGKARLVEFAALAEHRRENVRLRTPAEPLPSGGPRHTAGESSGRRLAGTQSDGVARKAQADAELREMDLAVRRGLLTPVAEIDRAGRDAIVLMQSAFDRAVEPEAATLSVRFGWDERQARIALKGFARIGLDVFHREMLKLLDDLARAREAGAAPGAAPMSLQ